VATLDRNAHPAGWQFITGIGGSFGVEYPPEKYFHFIKYFLLVFMFPALNSFGQSADEQKC